MPPDDDLLNESHELTNLELARAMEDIAVLLALKKENPFKLRAYERAARALQTLSEPASKLLAEGTLEALPGVGEAIGQKLTELITTGKLDYLEKLRAEFPPGLLEIANLQGFGPKRAAQIYQELGITTIEQLQAAAANGELRQLAGFGEKLEQNVLKAIEQAARHSQRFRLDEAREHAENLLRRIRGVKGVQQVVIAGSLRRRQETIGDVDMLVTCEDSGPVMEAFVGHPRVERMLSHGPTRSSVILGNGLQVDLRAVPEESFGAALQYFTGNKDHNVQVRHIAKQLGLKVNEYGVFREEDEARVAGETEESVYEVLGLPCFAPELRQATGEFEAAEAGRLPKLVELDELCGDLHLHTTASDGQSSIEELCEAALARGYEYLAITDHSVSQRQAGGLDAEGLLRQLAAIEKARRQFPDLTLFSGCEVDLHPDGALDLPDTVLERLDLVLASVHSRFNLPEPEQTARLIKGLRNPLVKILAHPTGRLINEREPYLVDLEEVFKVAAEEGKALEVNAQPKRLDLSDTHCRRAIEQGCLLALGTDAHHSSQLQLMEYGVWTARRGWAEAKDILNTRSASDLAKWLGRN